MSFAEGVHATAGIGVGTFLGVFLVLFALKRGGRDVKMLHGSSFFTALVAGMGAWVVAAIMRMVMG